MNMQESGNISSLAKSVLSVLLAILLFYLLFWRGWIWGILLGILVLGIGLAIWFRVRMGKLAKRQENHTVEHDTVERHSEASRDGDGIIIDDGNIRVTDLSDAREVDFEKE